MAEERPAFEELPLEDLLSVHELMYLPQTLSLLVGHLEKGIASGDVSLDLCAAILRLYLLYPQCANAEIVRKILIQSILGQPDNNFTYFAAMTPVHFATPEENKRVMDIFTLQEHLEGCNFKEVWALLKEPDMSDVLHTPGLADAIRRFACDAMQLSVSTIGLQDFIQMLNLNQSNTNNNAVDEKMEKILKARNWVLEDAGPGTKIVRILAPNRDADQARPVVTRGSVAHKTVEKYLSVEGLRQSLALLQSS